MAPATAQGMTAGNIHDNHSISTASVVTPLHRTTPNGANGSANTETNELAQQESRLYEYSTLLGRLIEDIKDWEIMTRHGIESLQRWGITFGAVLGLAPLPSAPNPAYEAFTSLLSSLSGLCTTLEVTLDPLLHQLEAMAVHPKRLLKEMHTLETLRTPLAKILSPNASKNHQRYIHLRSELSSQLPFLFDAMDRAIGLVVRIMTQGFLKDVRDKWIKLFESLQEGGERYGGDEETLRAWRVRWESCILGESPLRMIHPSFTSIPARLSVTPAELPPVNGEELDYESLKFA